MEKAILKFDDTKVPKQKFRQYKRPISIKNADIDKIVVSNKVPFGKKKDLKVSLATKMLKNLTFMCISTKNECI